MPAKKKASGKKPKKTTKKNSLDAALTPTPAQVQQMLKMKFDRIKQIREHLAQVKALYQEHDKLMTEVLPLFIEVQDDKFIVNREVKIRGKTYRLSPYFFDEKKGLVAKVWKSTPFESVSIS